MEQRKPEHYHKIEDISKHEAFEVPVLEKSGSLSVADDKISSPEATFVSITSNQVGLPKPSHCNISLLHLSCIDGGVVWLSPTIQGHLSSNLSSLLLKILFLLTTEIKPKVSLSTQKGPFMWKIYKSESLSV